MDRISRFLKTKSNAITMFISAVMNIIIGVLILSNPDFFIHSIAMIFIIYFALQILVNLFSMVFSIGKGIKALIGNIIKASFSVLVFGYLIINIEKILGILPFIMCIWAFVVGVASLVSFLQYRHEKSTAPIRYLLSSIINIGFGISFIANITGAIPLSFTVVAIYMILLGATNLTDCISDALNKNQKAKLKGRIRFTPPPYLTALIPVKVLNSINEYLTYEKIQTVDLTINKNDTEPNLEVFVHVSPNGLGQMGHVDMAIENRVVSFGGYDMQSMKLGGGIGIGVLFENFNKDEYIKFCQKESEKTLFGFGLVLKRDEISAIIKKLDKIKENGYVWKCNAQREKTLKSPQIKLRNQQENSQQENSQQENSQQENSQQENSQQENSQQEFDDYASLLYLATGATYYKFKSGAFKYYWVLGTNCVKLADTLLSSCGLDTLAGGVITPGTYYNYLNNEFMREGSRVVKRTVYYEINTDKNDYPSKDKN